MDEPQAQPAQVPPAPVPTAFTVSTVRAEDGSALVVIQAQTPVGMAVYFMDAGFAVQLGNALRAEGKAGVSRLAVPANGLVVPGR